MNHTVRKLPVPQTGRGLCTWIIRMEIRTDSLRWMGHFRALFPNYWVCIQCTCHSLVPFSYLDWRRLYDTLRNKYYCPYIANDSYTTVAHSHSFALKETIACHQNQLLLFPAAGPLEFLPKNILNKLPKMKLGNKRLVVLIDCYTERTSPMRVFIVADTGGSEAHV